MILVLIYLSSKFWDVVIVDTYTVVEVFKQMLVQIFSAPVGLMIIVVYPNKFHFLKIV